MKALDLISPDLPLNGPGRLVRFSTVKPNGQRSVEPDTYYVNRPTSGVMIALNIHNPGHAVREIDVSHGFPDAIIGCDLVGQARVGFVARLPSGVEQDLKLVRLPRPELSWIDRYDLRGLVAVRGEVLLQCSTIDKPGSRFDTTAALRATAASLSWSTTSPAPPIATRSKGSLERPCRPGAFATSDMTPPSTTAPSAISAPEPRRAMSSSS